MSEPTQPEQAERVTCPKCGRPFATVHDFRATQTNEHALDGLCPTGYAIRDPDAAQDCEATRAAAVEFAKGGRE